MELPFPLDPAEQSFTIDPSAKIMELIEMAEDTVEKASVSADRPCQFQVHVIWNLRNPRKALDPHTVVGEHFKDGDTCGIHGDFMPIKEPPRKIPEEDKIPVTILTGFLGAGKTTLLNYILQEQKEKKIAVIENEFGEISIDDALLKQNKLALAEKVIVMDNGCMCCTVRGDLLQGLNQILEDIKKGGKIDVIMIETTGMADPVPIVRTFMTNPELCQDLRLDGVITVVDAKNILKRLDDEVEKGKVNEAYQQVAFCDKILLNKLDLVSSDDAIAVKDRIRSLNSFAKILPSVRGRVKMSELTDLRAHDMANFVNTDLEKEAEEPKMEEHGHGGHSEHGGHAGHEGGHDDHGGHSAHGAGHEADCAEDHGEDGGHASGHGHVDAHGHVSKKSRHDSRVNSFGLAREGEIIPQRLSRWMQSLGQLPEDKGTIFRIKAILAVKGHPYKHVFHAVMDVSDEDDAGPWEEGEKKVSKIVFIGKGLDRQFLTKGFDDIFEK